MWGTGPAPAHAHKGPAVVVRHQCHAPRSANSGATPPRHKQPAKPHPSLHNRLSYGNARPIPLSRTAPHLLRAVLAHNVAAGTRHAHGALHAQRALGHNRLLWSLALGQLADGRCSEPQYLVCTASTAAASGSSGTACCFTSCIAGPSAACGLAAAAAACCLASCLTQQGMQQFGALRCIGAC